MMPEAFFQEYLRAFGTLDPDRIASFFHVPAIFLTPMGVATAEDEASARAVASRFVEHARGQGAKRTELVGSLDVRPLAQGLVQLAGTFRRLDASDQEVFRAGFTYTLRDDGSGWKIAVLAVHDAPSAG